MISKRFKVGDKVRIRYKLNDPKPILILIPSLKKNYIKELVVGNVLHLFCLDIFYRLKCYKALKSKDKKRDVEDEIKLLLLGIHTFLISAIHYILL